MSIYEALIAVFGELQPQYEIFFVFMSFWVMLYLISCAFSIIASIINWIGGKQ